MLPELSCSVVCTLVNKTNRRVFWIDNTEIKSRCSSGGQSCGGRYNRVTTRQRLYSLCTVGTVLVSACIRNMKISTFGIQYGPVFWR